MLPCLAEHADYLATGACLKRGQILGECVMSISFCSGHTGVKASINMLGLYLLAARVCSLYHAKTKRLSKPALVFKI